MLRSLLQAIILILVSSFIACGAFDRSEERVVIRVGEREITKKELIRNIKSTANRVGIPDQEIKAYLKPLIKQIVDDYLVLEYGRREGITVSDNELKFAILDIKRDYQGNAFQEVMLSNYVDYEEWKEDFRHRILIRKILEKVSGRMPPITSQEVKAYFEAHREDFRHPKMVKFRQVVARSKEEAETLLGRLNRGETLVDLSGSAAVGKGHADGGEDLGWFLEGELEETMEKALFSLPVGQRSEIVQTPYGYHIIEVLEIRPEGLKSLPEVMGEIESRLLKERRTSFHARWMEGLKAHIPVHVDQETVNALEFGQIKGG